MNDTIGKETSHGYGHRTAQLRTENGFELYDTAKWKGILIKTSSYDYYKQMIDACLL